MQNQFDDDCLVNTDGEPEQKLYAKMLYDAWQDYFQTIEAFTQKRDVSNDQYKSALRSLELFTLQNKDASFCYQYMCEAAHVDAEWLSDRFKERVYKLPKLLDFNVERFYKTKHIFWRIKNGHSDKRQETQRTNGDRIPIKGICPMPPRDDKGSNRPKEKKLWEGVGAYFADRFVRLLFTRHC